MDACQNARRKRRFKRRVSSKRSATQTSSPLSKFSKLKRANSASLWTTAMVSHSLFCLNHRLEPAGGDLQRRIKDQRGRPFSENQILDWFTQICLGMKHIHDRKVIHRDLKGQNIFMTTRGFVKIGDLGIAKVLQQTLQKARTCVGTPYYLSPEIVQSQPYTFSTDVWSMGVMLYEMCTLRPPFDAPSLHMLSMKIVRGAYTPVSSNFSQGLRNLIRDCLQVTPSRRPTVNAILKLSIIQNRIKTNLSTSVVAQEFSHTILHR